MSLNLILAVFHGQCYMLQKGWWWITNKHVNLCPRIENRMDDVHRMDWTSSTPTAAQCLLICRQSACSKDSLWEYTLISVLLCNCIPVNFISWCTTQRERRGGEIVRGAKDFPQRPRFSTAIGWARIGDSCIWIYPQQQSMMIKLGEMPVYLRLLF